MLNTAYSSWPSFTEEEADAVRNVLLSNKVNYWTGTECKLFEEEFAEWTNVKHAIALANGTVALDIALKALNIGPGDEVIVTPRTFIASVSCIVLAGATPVFADIDQNSQNITAETIRAVLSSKTKAIICVHLAGWPCEMDDIMDLAHEHQLYVIEDCAQAHGAKYKGRPVGSIGHIGAWSFCQDKIMTTGGEGGMVTTNDSTLWSKMWSYKDHGKSHTAIISQPKFISDFSWVHEQFGTNWRMTEIQATIGRIQLKRMEQWHTLRLNNAKKIWANSKQVLGLRTPDLPKYIEHAAYKCYIFLVPELLPAGWDRKRIIQTLHEDGVPCYPGSSPEVYLEKAFEGQRFKPRTRLPVAQKLGETSLMFLVHPTLRVDEIEKTIEVLSRVMRRAGVCMEPSISCC